MEKFKYLQKIKDIYSRGGNVIQYLRNLNNSQQNTIEDILISYDFQSGSYIKNFAKNQTYNQNYCSALAKIIDNIGGGDSIIEVGVGEGTTLNTVLRNLKNKPTNSMGFDISWSRLKFAKNLLNDFKQPNFQLFVADLFNIPLKDSSIDIVYTSHSIEPNGGREEDALRELYRITKKYLVLLEPSYEFANEEGKERMKKHGYVTQLYATAQKLKLKIVEHRLFDFYSNPLNPTGLLIIEKQSETSNESHFVCPNSQTPLISHSDALFYSPESFLAYPVVEQIPCLLKDHAVLATHLQTDYQEFKKAQNIDYHM